MGKKSRDKGANGEREVVAIARECGFQGAKRGAPMQAGYSDSEFDDVIGTGILKIESKRYKRTPVNRFADQYVSVESPGFVRTLAWRDDNSRWYAAVKLEDLLKMAHELSVLRTTRCADWDI